MADTGILTASSLITFSDGPIFTNPQNMLVSDGVYATVSLGDEDYSETLLLNFSPNIPITATINGFEILVRGFASVEGVVFCEGAIINPNDETFLSDIFSTGFLSTSNGYVSAGGPTDLLGYSGPLTPTFVNNNTALMVYIGANSAASVSIDAIQLRIYYTPEGSGVSTGILTASSLTTIPEEPFPGITMFTNPQNARVPDGVYATASLDAGEPVNLFVATFSPNIPLTATSIDGFELLVRGFASVEGVVFVAGIFFNINDGTELSDIFSTGFLSTSNGYVSAGGPPATLGYSGPLTPTFVNNNTALGVQIVVNSAASVSIDAIQLRIYYTPESSGVSSSLMMTGCGS